MLNDEMKRKLLKLLFEEFSVTHRQLVEGLFKTINKNSENTFENPVLETYPALKDTYLQLVHHPKCFSDIRKDMRATPSKYKFLGQVVKDVELCFSNCEKFNRSYTPLIELTGKCRLLFVNGLLSHSKIPVKPEHARTAECFLTNELLIEHFVQENPVIPDSIRKGHLDDKRAKTLAVKQLFAQAKDADRVALGKYMAKLAVKYGSSKSVSPQIDITLPARDIEIILTELESIIAYGTRQYPSKPMKRQATGL
ncbi:hypothetical protein ADUPG1_007960 [Aduncisulcus paluster]|uniref:Bromo domain-containing protein n=1 Tax=Aduncisulcus paluster TaxID=2918883 RepID=A0ABQ5KTA4_9EUKA|nr:hypothetical protein ADUPG1_007960 [Aduncisulcus paluster]